MGRGATVEARRSHRMLLPKSKEERMIICTWEMAVKTREVHDMSRILETEACC